MVAISNNNEPGMSAEDTLRRDLYFRLNALKITVPPLRKRGDDILDMFNRLCETYADDYGCDTPIISAQDAAQLLKAPWPGNVRQLMNVAEQTVLQARRGQGTISSLLMSDDDNMTTVVTSGR